MIINNTNNTRGGIKGEIWKRGDWGATRGGWTATRKASWVTSF